MIKYAFNIIIITVFTCEKEIHSEHYATHKEFSEMVSRNRQYSLFHNPFLDRFSFNELVMDT